MPHQRTALVVDDDEDMQFLLSLYVREADYDVVGQVGDGLAAMAEWERRRGEGEPLHALVLDQMMPGMTGLQVVEAVRAEDPDVVLVLISAAMSPSMASTAKAAGADHALAKTDLRNLTAALTDDPA